MSATPLVSGEAIVAAKNVLKMLALGAGLGIPAGAAMYGARRMLSPAPKTPSVSVYTDLPLIDGLDATPEKSAGVLDKLTSMANRFRGSMSTMPQSHIAAGTLAGGGIGTGLGYGGARYLDDTATQTDLDAQLKERIDRFNGLLLQEQMRAAGVKAAAVIDEALDTIFEDVMEKSAESPKDIAIKELASSPIFPTLLALTGLYYGASTGYGNYAAQDRNRATMSALESSLEQRLRGNPEGPKAPMVVKVHTDRLGSTPISGTATGGRDVLSRL